MVSVTSYDQSLFLWRKWKCILLWCRSGGYITGPKIREQCLIPSTIERIFIVKFRAYLVCNLSSLITHHLKYLNFPNPLFGTLLRPSFQPVVALRPAQGVEMNPLAWPQKKKLYIIFFFVFVLTLKINFWTFLTLNFV